MGETGCRDSTVRRMRWTTACVFDKPLTIPVFDWKQRMIHLNEMIEDVLGEFSAPAQRKNLSLSMHGGKADIEGYGRSEQPAAFAMVWGHKFENGPMVFNARSEDAETRQMFADGMKQRRCLVPASCYYEWEHVGKEKIKYAIKSKGSQMIYMAGIYRPVQAKGKRIGHECFILTRDPAEEIRFIHDRMPVILPKEATADWLNPKYAAGDVLKAAAMDMEYRQVSGQIYMNI